MVDLDLLNLSPAALAPARWSWPTPISTTPTAASTTENALRVIIGGGVDAPTTRRTMPADAEHHEPARPTSMISQRKQLLASAHENLAFKIE
ncbi:MAG: hypothetical protein V9H69_06875 [Anaerolineae bacterium]